VTGEDGKSMKAVVPPRIAGAACGFADMGPWHGGQAEYLRVPWADFDCLRLPEDARERENDYVMLSDISPTGWQSTETAGLYPGDTVVTRRRPDRSDGRALRHLEERVAGLGRGPARSASMCRPVRRYNRYLRSLVHEGKCKPSWIVSHELPLERAPEAYKSFDSRLEGWTKVVLKPQMH
jgi:threonine dehydrogenase-like Zn-dependent dehydrogenase